MGVPSPALLAVGLDEVPSAGLVPAGVLVWDPVVELIPVLLVVELNPAGESVPSAGANGTVVPSDVGTVPETLPSAGVSPGAGTLGAWSAAGFGTAG